MFSRWSVMILGCTLGHGASALEAEYAFRWDPSKGGPVSAEAARDALNVGTTRERSFEVRYLVAGQSPSVPAGLVVLARERSNEDGPESTYKLRGPESIQTTTALQGMSCPLTGPKMKSKLELDIGWSREKVADAIGPKRMVSWSCEVEAAASSAFPMQLQVIPLGCSSRVRRLKAGDWKIEEWMLPKGRRAIEVSFSAADSDINSQKFQKAVDQLLALGSEPIEESKSVLGSDCSR
ncbi:hypothetical protein GNX71_28445 [Variovorax sp. RKNM96]|uniref:hypothetical protein n=1 Tax=Variovorax sp. RKNM96 TaxID=2681552 RepID=UPI0019810433|nr:hypothetical protein [Variovorax sp. RKNM96]QSI33285.1 hypothetical protein GNX71_28445 [Variovorax sp. RKNM96]